MSCGRVSPSPRTCLPTPEAIGASAVATDLGRCTIGTGGRDLGGRGRSAFSSPLASQLCHEPRASGRGHPRRPAPDGPLEHRDDHEVPAPVGRRSPRRHRPGVSRELRCAYRRIVRGVLVDRRGCKGVVLYPGAPHLPAALWARATAQRDRCRHRPHRALSEWDDPGLFRREILRSSQP